MPDTATAPAAETTAPAAQTDVSAQAPPVKVPEAAKRSLDTAFNSRFRKSDDPKPEPAAPQEPKAESAPVPEVETETEKQKETQGTPETKPEPKTAKDKPVRKTPFQLLHEREAEVKSLRAELEQLKSVPSKPDPELTTKYDALKAEHQKALDELQYVAYERHPDFQENYMKPFAQAWEAGRRTVSAMTLTDGQGNTRKGTAQDFDNLMMLRNSDPDRAAQAVVEMFGPKALSVETRMNALEEREAALSQARQDYKTKGIERIKEREAAAAKQREQLTAEVGTMLKQAYESVPREYPDMLQPVEGDEKGNEDLKIGYERAQKAFANVNPLDPRLTPEQRKEITRLHAETIHFAAASRRLIRWHRNDQATIKSLQGKLAQYEKSVPKGGEVGTEPKTPQDWRATMRSGLNKLARR